MFKCIWLFFSLFFKFIQHIIFEYLEMPVTMYDCLRVYTVEQKAMMSLQIMICFMMEKM